MIQVTAASVATLLTTVGFPRYPTVDGYGGVCSGWPRFPASALSSTVSSPIMLEPCSGRTLMMSSRPLPSTFAPRTPSRSASRMIPSSPRIASVYSARTAMNASRAPTASAAIASPSTTDCAFFSRRSRFVNTAGSDSYPFATAYLLSASLATVTRHFSPVRNPPPPRPRRPAAISVCTVAAAPTASTLRSAAHGVAGGVSRSCDQPFGAAICFMRRTFLRAPPPTLQRCDWRDRAVVRRRSPRVAMARLEGVTEVPQGGGCSTELRGRTPCRIQT